MSPAPTAFRDLLLNLDAAGLREFVAAVYAARGWAVDRSGDDLRVRAAGERDWLRLAVALGSADGPTDTDADRVVVPTLAADVDADIPDERLIDAADLLELLRYAVDDAARTRLFRDFFDRDSDDFVTAADRGADAWSATDPSAEADSTGPTPSTAAPDETPTAPEQPDVSPDVDSDSDSGADASPVAPRLAVAVIVLLVVGGVAVAVGPTLVPPGEDAGDADTDPTGGNVTADTDAPGVAVAANRTVPSTHAGVVAVDGPLPPGVDATGIANASALADAHEAALDGRSYRLSVVAREFVGGRPTALARERTVVEAPTRYRSDVSVIGTFRQQPRVVGTTSAYADGTMRFVRLTTDTEADGTIRFTERGRESGTAGGPGWRSVAVDPAVDPFANRTATHLRGVLDVDDAAVVGSFEREGTTYVWIDLRRRPPGGTDAIDSILVDEHGLVHELRHEYAYLPPEASTVRTVVTVRTEPANVTASPPPWLDAG